MLIHIFAVPNIIRMKMKDIWNYRQPVDIYFGCGQLERLGDFIDKIGGRRGLLVTSQSFVSSGMAQNISQLCKSTIVAVYGQVCPNPDVTDVDRCSELIAGNRCDYIVAIGGGSVMDCAKAASVYGPSQKSVRTYFDGDRNMPLFHLPVVAIPTTAGTGSEVTSVSVISDHAKGEKEPLASDAFYPAIALVDPSLTYSMPPHLTACTGMDALCHAIEAFWGRKHQPVCDALAVKALKLILNNITDAYADGANCGARVAMSEASLLAGLAFALPKTSSAHACSYPLTNVLGIPHGEACALTIDYWLRFNAAHGDERSRILVQELGFEDAGKMADRLGELKAELGLMTNLKSFNLSTMQIDNLIEATTSPNLLNNPVEIHRSDIADMYRSLL